MLLALVREHDVVLESFRPGVLDRLGVGYEAMRAVNPRIVLCSITGYGQDGPLRDRAGHDINYLALTGVLGLTGEPGGPPVQSAGQIADLGGGALMAAFGILAALREAERTGEGQVVDVAMADGALSWLALVAARVLNDGDAAEPPARGMLELAGGLACYRPYACADGGWVALGALEPKFWATWCRGVGREDLIAEQFAAPGSTGHAAVEAVFAARTRADWAAFAADHECCLEPVLDLGEALSSGQVRAREMVVALDQPGATEPVSLLGAPVKLSRTPADCNRLPGPELGEHTEAVLRAAGLRRGAHRRALGRRRRRGSARPGRRRRGLVPRVVLRIVAPSLRGRGTSCFSAHPEGSSHERSSRRDHHPDRRRGDHPPLRQRDGRDQRRRGRRVRHDRRCGRRLRHDRHRRRLR